MPRAKAFSMGAQRPKRYAHTPNAQRAAAAQPRHAEDKREARGAPPRANPGDKQACEGAEGPGPPTASSRRREKKEKSS